MIYHFETILYTIQPYDTLGQLAQLYNTTINTIANFNPDVDLNVLHVGQKIYISPGYRDNQHSMSKLDLNNDLRLLWEQHVFWTRLTIVSLVFGLPDVEVVTNRLLRNPKDFEALFEQFFGVQNAAKFAELLTEHLVIAAELVKAAKNGDTNSATAIEKKWYANADEIAAFLSHINQYWSQNEWKAMFYRHLFLTKAEAVDLLNKNYTSSINQFDEIEKEALMMADNMTEGILKLFHNEFVK